MNKLSLLICLVAQLAGPLARADSCLSQLVPHLHKLVNQHRGALAGGTKIQPRELALEISGVEGLDLYNPSGIFKTVLDGKSIEVIAIRGETAASETDTRVVFFQVMNDWKTEGLLSVQKLNHEGLPRLDLQDPFVTTINGELILGAVRTIQNAEGRVTGYYTAFYRDHGKGIAGLTHWFDGPVPREIDGVEYPGMKDIRFVDLGGGKVGVFTRPQGPIGGRGKVGFYVANTMSEINAERIASAPIIEGQVREEHWLGVNSAELLPNGMIGVLGHVARYSTVRGKQVRHYYAASWIVNPETGEAGPITILLERKDLPGGLGRGSKREDLRDVIFSGELVRLGNGRAILIGGEGDKRMFAVEIDDPFLERAAGP